MFLTCPNCHTKFRIADEHIKSEGSKLRCTQCSHIFSATPDDGEAEQVEEPLTETQEIDANQDESEFSLHEDKNEFYSFEKKTDYKKFSLFAIPIIVILAGMIGTGYFFYPQIKEMIPLGSNGKQTQKTVEQKNNEENSDSGDVEVQDIVLNNVRQYMVDNEKIGQLLVIEGKVHNQSQKSKKGVKLKAQLYDDQGEVLQDKTFLSGKSVSLFQLQILNREKLEDKLNLGESASREEKVVTPQKAIKFMCVFFNPPQKLAEFSLQVVEAKDVE